MRRREVKNWWNQRDISWDSWTWSITRLGSWFNWAKWCFRFLRSKGMSILSSCGRKYYIWRRNTLNKWRINWLQRQITLSWCSNCWIVGISWWFRWLSLWCIGNYFCGRIWTLRMSHSYMHKLNCYSLKLNNE